MKCVEGSVGKYYQCHDGRQLKHIRTEERRQKDFRRTFEVYGCEDCSGCEHKARCLYMYDEEKDFAKNKVMKINERWDALCADTHSNIESQQGILNRQIRSIQTEGHFGDIKENEKFERFNYRSTDKVAREFKLSVFGRNLNKYHRFSCGALKKFEGKIEHTAAQRKCAGRRLKACFVLPKNKRIRENTQIKTNPMNK